MKRDAMEGIQANLASIFSQQNKIPVGLEEIGPTATLL
jgi:hypothetical protein